MGGVSAPDPIRFMPQTEESYYRTRRDFSEHHRPLPVADGTFDGRLRKVSYARTAKATASLASASIPNSSDLRNTNIRQKRLQVTHKRRIAHAAA